MPKVSLAFFTVAPLYGLAGMVWGMIMAKSGDHSMMPAHAHLNLLGLVVMSIMGTFYALAGTRVNGKLAWANFAVSNVAVLIMIPTLAKLLASDEAGAKKLEPIVASASGLAALGLLLFFISILLCWRKPASEA